LSRKQRREDKVLTRLFNNLQNDPKRTAKAIHKKNGELTLNVGAPNTIKEFFQSAGRFIKNPFLSPEVSQIEENSAFQEYKSTLNAEGFDVTIPSCDEYSNSAKARIIANRLGPLTVGIGIVISAKALIVLPLLPIFGSYFLTGMTEFAKDNNNDSHHAHIHLKIKKLEQQPQPLAIEDKSAEAATAILAIENKTSQTQDIQEQDLLGELSNKIAKQPQKKPVRPQAIY
jgi:hypothetical protein